jgi:hypothetical protein
MFALRSRIEIVARIALTVVMLFSALGPTTAAKADSLSEESDLEASKWMQFNWGKL